MAKPFVSQDQQIIFKTFTVIDLYLYFGYQLYYIHCSQTVEMDLYSCGQWPV